METSELNNLESTIKAFVEKYYNKVNVINAQHVYDEFDSKWIKTIDFDKDLISKYGKAIVSYSTALFVIQNTNEQDISYLVDLISEFDNNTNTKFQFSVKEILYWNLGLCWHKLGNLYDNYAVDAFKKYIYYLIAPHENIIYPSTAFAYKKCSTYLYQMLVNNQLCLISPTEFNDPFDCPIRELLYKDDDVAVLLHRAYEDCLKVSCFVSNTILNNNINGSKSKDVPGEYLNALMWAHYADSHKGVCIKYRFSTSFANLGNDYNGKISFFKDVHYSDIDLNSYSKTDSITMKDAFFLKGKQWAYENELRFISFDKDGTNKYDTIDIPNCIEAIYFGLHCSKNDRKTIQNIMRDKKCIVKDICGKVIFEQNVQFYQIIMDKEHFGQFLAEKIENAN